MTGGTTGFMSTCAFAIAIVLSLPVAAQRPADSYPSRPVTIIVPVSAGAVTDIETRFYAQKLTELTGRNFIVDYKAGAGSMIGSAHVAKSAADGYTLLAATQALSIAPLLYKNLNFDPIKDFTFVSMISKRAPMLLATPSLPVKNVAEYLAYARAHPGIAMMPNVKAGKARILAMTSAERAKILPDIPTVAEQGVPGFEYAPWLGFAVPRGTPAAIVAQLNALLVSVAKTPELAARLADDATLMIGSTPEQFAQVIAAEYGRWRKLIDETGMKLEH